MNGNKDISAFYEILKYIREQYGGDIFFSPKRLKALLSDLNPQFKDEEKKVMFLINENQSFVRNVYQQQNVSADSIFREIGNLCGFNKDWTLILTQSLLIITGKIDGYQSILLNSNDEDSLNTESGFGDTYDIDSFLGAKPHYDSETDKTSVQPNEDIGLFSVELVYVSHDVVEKIRTIKIIREISGLGVKEASYLYEHIPALVSDNLSFAEAEKIKNYLEQYGGKASIRKKGGRPTDNKTTVIAEETSAPKHVEYDKAIVERIRTASKNNTPILFVQGSGDLLAEIMPGIQFYCPHTANGNVVSHLVLNDSNVIIIDKVITTKDELMKLVNSRNITKEKSLLIVANDITGEAMEILIKNMSQMSTKWCAVKAPGYGDRRKNLLRDLAIIVGANVITTQPDRIMIEEQGYAASIHIGHEHTTLLNPSGRQDQILNQISIIKDEMSKTISEFDREKLKERIDNLSKGVLVIKNAGKTPEEVKLTETRLLVEAGWKV